MSSDVESTLHKPNVPCGSNTPVLTDAAGAFGEPKWVPKSDRCLHLTNEDTIVWTGKATLDVVNFSSFHSPDQYEYQDHQASSTKAQSCYPRAKRLQAHSRKHEGGSQCTRPSHPRQSQWGRPGRTLVSQNVQSVSEGLSMFGSEKISHISSESAQT